MFLHNGDERKMQNQGIDTRSCRLEENLVRGVVMALREHRSNRLTLHELLPMLVEHFGERYKQAPKLGVRT